MLRGRRRLGAALALTALAAAVLAGCGDDDETASPSPSPAEDTDNTLQVDMVDYAYDVSGSLQEGWTTFEVSNTGDEYHMIATARMKEGVTIADVQAAFAEEGGPPDGGEGQDDEGEGVGPDEGAPVPGEEEQSLGEVELISAQTEEEPTTSSTDGTQGGTTEDTVTTQQEGEQPGEGTGDEGGPDGEEEGEEGDPFDALFDDPDGVPGPPGHVLAPGESITMVTEELVAGDYAMICFINSPDGTPHLAQGMIGEFSIEESDEPAGEEPEADVQLTLREGEIELPAQLTAGEQTFEVDIEAGEHEFAVIEQVQDDLTYEQLSEYFATIEESPPTADELGDGPAIFEAFIFSGVGDPMRYYVTVDLQPGTYWIGCPLEERSEEGEGIVRDHGETELKQVTVT